MAIIQSSLILALAGAAAAAATAKYPEVKPGPGLPSLAELGITSAELYQMGKPAFRKSFFTHNDAGLTIPDSNAINGAFSANLDPGCGPTDAYTYDINGVIVCYNYLAKLGDTACVVPADGSSAFCASGDAAITGKSQLSGSGTSSTWYVYFWYCGLSDLLTVPAVTLPMPSSGSLTTAPAMRRAMLPVRIALYKIVTIVLTEK